MFLFRNTRFKVTYSYSEHVLIDGYDVKPLKEHIVFHYLNIVFPKRNMKH